MFLVLDAESTEPLYLQLVGAVRGAIVEGNLQSGERLPAARELAASLGMNMHTVLRAYSELRDAGVIEVRRGRGAVVTSRSRGAVELDHAVRTLLDVAQRHGLTLAQIHAAVDEGARA